MAQLTEDYVSFDVAKLLEKKGFDGEWHKHYWGYKPGKEFLTESFFNPEYDYPAPTLQAAMKWLRKEHHLNIIVDCYTDHAEARIMTIEDLPACKCRGIIGEKYEEACNAAIKYYLEHLI